MKNFAFYSALRGKDDWRQKRADAQYSLKVRDEIANRQAEKTAKQMQYQEYYHKYMDKLQELKVLGADQERIRQAELEARRGVVEGVSKHGGDVTRFMQGGGITILENYENTLMNDARVKKAISNKENWAQILKAKSEGKFVHRAPVRLAVKNPETGEQMIDPKTGQPVFETKMVDADQQIAMHNQGLTDQILFTGAENDIDIQYEDFWKHKKPKDPNNPWSNDTSVSWQDVYNRLIEKGAGEQQARYKAQKYAEQVNSGMKPWSWYKGDQLDYQLKKARLGNIHLRNKAIKKQLEQQSRDFTLSVTNNAVKGINSKKAVPEEMQGAWNIMTNVKKNKDGSFWVPSDRKFRVPGTDKQYSYGELKEGGRLIMNDDIVTEQGRKNKVDRSGHIVYNDIPLHLFFDPKYDDLVNNHLEEENGIYRLYLNTDVTKQWENVIADPDNKLWFNAEANKAQKGGEINYAEWNATAQQAYGDAYNMATGE